jgi:hypothetical protein
VRDAQPLFAHDGVGDLAGEIPYQLEEARKPFQKAVALALVVVAEDARDDPRDGHRVGYELYGAQPPDEGRR